MNDEHGLAVEFVAVRADMTAFQSFVTARVRREVRSPSYYGGLVMLAALTGILLSGVVGFRFDVATAIVVLLLTLLCWWFVSKLYRGAVAPLDEGSLVGPRRIVIDDEGVRQIAPLHEARTRWRGVLSVHETATHLFLMTDRLAGYIVPRRAFADAAQYEAFAGFARSRTTSSATSA